MIFPNQIDARYSLILSYLLAELSQEEIAELDAEMLTQPESLSLFEEGVADMMDAYADQRLDPALAVRLEQLVHLHPSARKQLTLARALKASRDASIGKTGEAISSWPNASRQRASGWLFPWTRMRLITAFAAMVLVLVSGLWLSRRGSIRGAGEAVRQGAVSSVPAATRKEATTPVFTVILLPTVLRGTPEPSVKVPSEAASVRLQALLPGGATVATSTLRLLSATGAEIQIFSALPTQKIETESYVEVTLPVAQLPPGDYRISLSDPEGKMVAEYRLVRIAASVDRSSPN